MVNILIVEDDIDLCETYRDALERVGHTVEVASSSKQAMDCLTVKRMKPDVVILDMQLHRESGSVILALIRRLPQLDHTKVIIASGYANRGKRAKTMWRADLFLQKPVALDQLRQTISKLTHTIPADL
jgi:CheY-like chemotaxis protein